jgi:hypothetical protein
MASSYTTCCATTTRRLTYSQKPRPLEARFPMVSSQVTNISRLCNKKVRSHPRSEDPRSWRSTNHQS